MPAVTVVNREADIASVLVSSTSLTTSETGTTASFNVTLSSAPLVPVTVSLTNGNPVQGSLSRTALTFDASNWNVAQAVTVTGLDDHIVHGDQTYQITGRATSSDSHYSGLSMSAVTVLNTEADVAGVVVSPLALTTSETGTSASFSVALT